MKRITGIASLEDGEDLFAAGVDSLQVTTLLKHLKNGLRETGDGTGTSKQFTAALIYSSPTVSKLAESMHKLNEQDGAKSRESQSSKNGGDV